MASVIRGSDNFDSLIHQGLGVNQTWQNVTASRALGVTYTNTTGKPKFISVYISTIAGTGGGTSLVVDGVTTGLDGARDTSYPHVFQTTSIIPNNSSYLLTSVNGTVTHWFELI